MSFSTSSGCVLTTIASKVLRRHVEKPENVLFRRSSWRYTYSSQGSSVHGFIFKKFVAKDPTLLMAPVVSSFLLKCLLCSRTASRESFVSGVCHKFSAADMSTSTPRRSFAGVPLTTHLLSAVMSLFATATAVLLEFEKK